MRNQESFYVREALERSLEEMEDVYLAEAALERFRVGGEKAISLEDVEHRVTGAA